MKEISIILAVFICSYFNNNSYASSNSDNNDNTSQKRIYIRSKEQSKIAAKIAVNKLISEAPTDILNNINNQNNNNNNDKIVESAKDLGSLVTQGEKAKEAAVKADQAVCSKENCNVGKIFGAKAVSARQTKLEEMGFGKNSENFPKDNKGYLDKANQQIKTASQSLNQITGEYKDCKPIEKEFSHKENQICDEYYDVKFDSCPLTQVVEIDSKYTYVCNKKRDEKTKICNDEIVHIACKKDAECDNGGVIAASVKSDMKWEYNYPTLRIGTIRDNEWKGNCDTYDRITEFEIRNKDKITEFSLVEVGFDDYLWIQLNGHTIYVGPNGGSKIEVINGMVENGIGARRWCELETNWHFSNLNVDLRPYLNEGTNTLFMRVIVAGSGEGWMKVKAKQHCCRDWDIKREEKCEYEAQG